MKRLALLSLALSVAGCANNLPKFDSANVISEFNAVPESNAKPPVLTKKVQPSNLKNECVLNVDLPAEKNPKDVDIKWYGSCENGVASGLGLIVPTTPIGKVYIVASSSSISDNDKIYYEHILSNNTYFIGISNNDRKSGKILNLTNNNGYAAPLEGYYLNDKKNNVEYTLLRNQVDGSAMYVKRYESGKTISVTSPNDYTSNIVQGIRMFTSNRLLFEGAKISSGKTLISHNGRYEDAESINPFIASEFAGVDNKLASSPAAYFEGLSKTEQLKATLCKRTDSDDINVFCNDKPYSFMKDEFERSAVTFRNQQQNRLANAEAQRMAAIRQQQIQQNNLNALNASFAQLNQTAQQLQRNALQNSQSYTQPSASVPVQNQNSIYRCQDLSSMTYCRQLR